MPKMCSILHGLRYFAYEEFIQKIQPFADLIDNLSPYASTYSPPWKQVFENLAKDQSESLGQILDAFEKGSPSALSDELHEVFLPMYDSSWELFETKIIPYLKEKVGAEQE